MAPLTKQYINDPSQRVLTIIAEAAAVVRDGGELTFVDEDGEEVDNDPWLS